MKVEQGGCVKMWLQQTHKELAVEGKDRKRLKELPSIVMSNSVSGDSVCWVKTLGRGVLENRNQMALWTH